MSNSKEMTVAQDGPESISRIPRVAPPVDVLENADELLMLIDVPGVEEAGLDIRLEAGQLDIEAKQSAPAEDEVAFEPLIYARSFALPNMVDESRVIAELNAGGLTVHLPKAEAAKPRRIAVKAG